MLLRGCEISFAIIESGGKQYRVGPGDLIDVELLDGNVGEQVTFEEVLLVGGDEAPHLGSPTVVGARVVGTIEEQAKADKIVVFKFKRRKMYRRKRGHRQQFTRIRIDDILFSDGGKSKPKGKKAVKPEETPRESTVKAISPEIEKSDRTSPVKKAAKKDTVKEAKQVTKKKSTKVSKKAAKGATQKKTKTAVKGVTKKKAKSTAKKPAAKKPGKSDKKVVKKKK